LVAQEAAADAMMNLDTDTTPCKDPDSPCIDYKESLVSRLVAVEIQGAGSVSAGFPFASPRNHVSTLHAFAGFKSYAGKSKFAAWKTSLVSLVPMELASLWW